MATYRCYFLDSRRAIVAVEVIQCADDAEAQRHATAMFQARRGDPPIYHGIEVWDRARLVHSYPPDDADWVSP
jgi:transposase